MDDEERIRYPIGRFTYDERVESRRATCIDTIDAFPQALDAALDGFGEEHLELRYREGGWTLCQLIHHLADGHGNSFYRFKLAMTEQDPPVKTWEETLWAETPDARTAPVDASLDIIRGTHARWAYLLRSMAPTDFSRIYRHPQNGDVPLDWLLQYMAWHCDHHLGHIAILRRMAMLAPASA
jgi:hypothetical protein